jgi:phosphoglucosamine mutase
MKETGAVLGGEQSGHTIFLDVSTTGDGILAALKVIEIMVRKGKSLSELAADFVHYPQKLINIRVSSKPDLSEIEEIQSVITAREEALKNKGRILVRYSGTENKARVMVECEDEALCDKYAAEIASAIEKKLGTV